MLQEAVYDLMVAAPHEPSDEHFTATEFHLYRAGYDMALVMALRVMSAAERRYALIVQTKRIETKRRRAEQEGGRR